MRKLLVITALIMIAGVAFSQEKTDIIKQDSTSYIQVSGKFIDSTGKPKSAKSIMLNYGEKGTMIVGEGGKMINPSTQADKNGNFHFQVNKLLLSNYEYKFILTYDRMGHSTIVVSDMNIPIVFEIDSTFEKIDLGEIKIK